LQAWKQAMPDVKGTVSRAVASGNTVVLEVTWAGTQTGSLQGPSGTVPPTGKRQTTRAGWILNFDGGKIKDSRHYFDMLALLQQLGVIPRRSRRRECRRTSDWSGPAEGRPLSRSVASTR
jgi:predicted ester cyclase